MKNVKEGKTNVSRLADHAWDKQHKVLWDKVDIVAREVNWNKRKIVEAAYILENEGCLSQESKDIPGVWHRNIRKFIRSRH